LWFLPKTSFRLQSFKETTRQKRGLAIHQLTHPLTPYHRNYPSKMHSLAKITVALVATFSFAGAQLITSEVTVKPGFTAVGATVTFTPEVTTIVYSATTVSGADGKPTPTIVPVAPAAGTGGAGTGGAGTGGAGTGGAGTGTASGGAGTGTAGGAGA